MTERTTRDIPTYAEARAMAARERAVVLRLIAAHIHRAFRRRFGAAARDGCNLAPPNGKTATRAFQRGRSTVPSNEKTIAPC